MKNLILTIFLTLISGPVLAATPNIILMMGDDHGWEETGYNGHPYVKTPVLDEMARSGLCFNRFYAAHPTCSPTRASFLTGRHPVRMGTFAPGWSMRPEEITIANILEKAGYYCAHFGKWHVGAVKSDSPLSPLAMGFHECLSHDNFFEIDASFSRNGASPKLFKGESSEVLIDEAIDSIHRSQQSRRPFFQIIWFGSPHEPYRGLSEDLRLYDALPKKYTKLVRLTSNKTGEPTKRPQGDVLRERYAEITAMDRAIGKLRDHLAKTGLSDNTFLFYCGDNGTSPESALGFPHRDAKGSIYEGGTLVPGLLEWPARIKQPRTTNVRASTSDLLPTVASVSGQDLPDRPLDGIDLSPVIDGTMTVRSSPICFWKFNLASTDSTDPYIEPTLQQGTTPLVKKQHGKLTRDFKNFHHPRIEPHDFLGSRAIIENDMKLIIQEKKNGTTLIELFDLKNDPSETRNLFQEYEDKAQRLKRSLHTWQTSVLKSLTGDDYTTQ